MAPASQYSESIILKFINQGKFYLVRVKDDTQHVVYGITDEDKFIIADDEGLRREVVAHAHDCDCDEAEFVVALELVEQIAADESNETFGKQLQTLKDLQVLNRAGSQYEGDGCEFKPHDLVVYKSRSHYPSRNSAYAFNHPGPDQITHITGVHWDEKLGFHVFHGYSVDKDGLVELVSSECWRFERFEKPLNRVDILKKSRGLLIN